MPLKFQLDWLTLTPTPSDVARLALIRGGFREGCLPITIINFKITWWGISKKTWKIDIFVSFIRRILVTLFVEGSR